jgi:hypothetical protein
MKPRRTGDQFDHRPVGEDLTSGDDALCCIRPALHFGVRFSVQSNLLICEMRILAVARQA